MDPLAELAYDFTPYRYGFNNPVFFSDASELFETRAAAENYMKVNKLSGANIEYDSDANLFRIIDGDVTITQFGNMIQKIYTISDVAYLNQTPAGGGGSSGANKLIKRLNTAYTNTGFRHFIEWDGWKELIKLASNGVALSKEKGSNIKSPNEGRDVKYIDIECPIDIIGALKVGATSTIPGVADIHTPNTFTKKSDSIYKVQGTDRGIGFIIKEVRQ